jgi:hypothetical protein
MSLDKVLALAGGGPAPADPDADLLLAVQTAAGELAVLLASDDDEDDRGKGDDGKGGDGDGGGHADHPTYKALVKKGVPAARASSMCARSDKKVKASRLAGSLAAMLSGRPGLDIDMVTLTPPSETAKGRRAAADEGDALPDGSYPVKSVRQLHSAATLAASHHGDWKAAQALIRRKAPKFGVDVSTLPGFGQSDEDGEKAAASMIELAAKAAGDGGIPMNHGPFNGTHTHTHFQSGAHSHPHQHAGDSHHDGGPLHRPGSTPKRNW